MKVYEIQPGTPNRTATTTTLDLDKFTADLREMTSRYSGIKLVSIGAMSTVDSAGPTYLAIWANEPAEAEPSEN